MPDEIDLNDPVRTRLDHLVPAVDVDAAWAEAGRRMQRDHRRQVMTRAAGALVVVLVVIGIGAVAARASRSGPQPVDVGGPEPAGVPGATTAAAPKVADELTVRCAPGPDALSAAVIAVGPAGLVVSFTNTSFGRIELDRVGTAPDDSQPVHGAGPSPEDPALILEAPPGTYDVRCADRGDEDTAAIGRIEVIDPNEYYTPPAHGTTRDPQPEIPCADATSELYTITPDRSASQVLTWRFGEVTIQGTGFIEGSMRPVTISNPSGVIAGGTVLRPTRGTGSVTLFVCSNAPPRPSAPPSKSEMVLKTESDANAWLDTTLQGPNGSFVALKPGSVVTRRETKLVQAGEAGNALPLNNAETGSQFWVVAMGYTDPDGTSRAALFQFSPSGDLGSFTRLGWNPDQPGVPWPPGFDEATDHEP